MKDLFTEVYMRRERELMLRTNEVDELRERMDNLIESRKYNKSIPEAVRELEK